MFKRILAGAAAAGLAATLFAASPASAACPSGRQSTVAPLATAPNGSTLYGAQSGTGGYIGVTGSTGWIEAGGSPTTGGYIRGSAHNTPVNGEIAVGASSQKLCVAGTTVK